jgi:inner membrane protein
MSAISLASERMTLEAAIARGHAPVRVVVASPVLVNPFRRDVVFGTDDAYGFGVVRWTPSPNLQLEPRLVAKNMNDPAIAEARQMKAISDFLYWSRLPLAKVERLPNETIVTLGDARYRNGTVASRFTRTIHLPLRGTGQPSACPPGERC